MKKMTDVLQEFLQKSDDELKEILKDLKVDDRLITCNVCGSLYYRGCMCPNCYGGKYW